ncbi:MAG: hypothetical protein ACFFDT_06450 [Candidatus Hodarchaeota archaeon]
MVPESTKHQKFPIRVDLDKEDEKRFKTVQEQYKLKNNAEVLRFCVNKVFYGMTLDIDADISNEIQNLITSRHIKIKYGITSIDDFIKRAISDFLETLKEEWSLKNWTMRQTLTPEENDTAVALLELQLKKIPGVTVDVLRDHLKTDSTIVRKHLEKFIEEGLLDFRESQGKIYYYAR